APKLNWTPNIWLGVTVESDEQKKRIPYLINTPAHIKYLSIEPMISEIKDYCKYLAQGTWNAKYKIDEILLRAVTGWRPDSMNAVDLAILRLAVFESFLDNKLDFKAAISEAKSIAQVFGADRSPRFIHGVLAKISEYLTNERGELENHE
ncbi:MAG: DUF5131 family protein, partial [Synergistaceae bacterium]|nr:DUF5131 family protein [Synergistaceae bacterium]